MWQRAIERGAYERKSQDCGVIFGDTREFLLNFYNWGVYELLMEEFSELIFSQHNWLKLKEKDLFYSHRIKVIIPDLSIYVPKSCKTIFPLPSIFIAYFSGYKGEIMSRDEFLFAFGMDGYTFLVEHYQFHDYEHFTIKEDCFVYKRCTYVNDWGTFPVYTSYRVPVHKLHKEKDYFENGLFWASTQQDLYLLLKEGLTPEGLSAESELSYGFLMKIYQTSHSFLGFDEWDDLDLQEYAISDDVLSEMEPFVKAYLLAKANLPTQTEELQVRLG